MKNPELWDCVIVGGGPAGMTAGIYLARYRRHVLVYDTLNSRAEKIPLSHNCPGFPGGISGPDLLHKLRLQLAAYQVPLIKKEVKSIQRIDKKKFLIQTAQDKVYAKNIILATGVRDIAPQLKNIAEGVSRGLIRYCPVCDAYEIIDKKIAVVGESDQALGEALFLRNYSQDVTLITRSGENIWTEKELSTIQKNKINLLSFGIKTIELVDKSIEVTFIDGHIIQFDCLYSALGNVKNNHLASHLKLRLKEGCIVVDKHQQTSMKGVYAAGDIVSGLNQICVASSQAAIAATQVHTRCR